MIRRTRKPCSANSGHSGRHDGGFVVVSRSSLFAFKPRFRVSGYAIHHTVAERRSARECVDGWHQASFARAAPVHSTSGPAHRELNLSPGCYSERYEWRSRSGGRPMPALTAFKTDCPATSGRNCEALGRRNSTRRRRRSYRGLTMRRTSLDTVGHTYVNRWSHRWALHGFKRTNSELSVQRLIINSMSVRVSATFDQRSA